ncbi:sodium- and chloride-dependent GABA transporter 1-like [Parasteatoda tepidariorum]|uniref:sodium- and chloride-dependent GABA transporter 1-like n=1 Tax=Parasteatoda tepidariorum TaxID=114398 RepID=UPI001C728A38|nr:sodium- and chloride-dependent GABA transporter 1-like [Parasteatoda tepidariorum]
MTSGKEKAAMVMDAESTVVQDYEEDVPDRGHWTGRFDFLLACLGNAVGLGNVWRFPYLCYRNGGGAFVLAYVIMVFLIGMPVFLLELSMGQYSAFGPSKVFTTISPVFKGVGYAMVISSSLVAIYYNMIIGWTLFYFVQSFRSDLQWQYCHHDFNTDRCFSDVAFQACKSDNSSNVYNFRTCYNETYAAQQNLTDLPEDLRISAPEEYLNNYMLGKSDSFENYGTIRWPLMLSLFVAWIIVVLSLLKGIKTSGRVVYFTATFPYVILVILFFRGVTLEGAADGIYFYLVPDFQKLQEISVWQDAAIQVFYSFGIAGGGMITYASYNKFNNNLIKDVIIIGMGDMLTSIFSGLVVFSMLGFMALQIQKSIHAVVSSGTGLAFIAYPDVLVRMPGATVWAILFFFMLFLLGIDSQFAAVETIITFVFDQFPKTRTKKPFIVIGTALVLFLLGLPLTTNGGIYLLEVMDTYAAGWPYLVTGLMELFVIAYVYGMSRFMRDLKEMTGWNPGSWVRSHLLVTVMTISPIVIGVILLLSWINFQPLTMGDYVFPMWGNAIGWTMALVPISAIPIGAIWQMCTKHKHLSVIQRFKVLIKPTDEWRANAKANSTSQIGNGNLTGYDNPALTEPPPVYSLSHL